MECHAANPLAYEAFSQELHDRAYRHGIPISGSLEVTQVCNVRCIHCYLPLAKRAGKLAQELSLAEIRRILDEIAGAGCLWLLLTGGEPLARPDFLEIYAEARRRGLILTLFTNGTLVNPRIADYLAEWRPFAIEISLYGATQATYERVTGIRGSYDRCRRGIDLLLERGLPLSLKTVVLNANQHELAAMRELAGSLGVRFQFDPVVNAGIEGDLGPVGQRLDPEQIVALEARDPQRAKAWPEAIRKHLAEKIATRAMYTCGAGRTSFHIDSYGRLCLCLSARDPSYDLRQGAFKEGWEGFLKTLLMREYSPDFECLDCDLRLICQQCPAIGQSESGDPEARSPFLCRLTHLRREAFYPPGLAHC